MSSCQMYVCRLNVVSWIISKTTIAKFVLIIRARITHICVSKIIHHWFRYLPLAWSMSNHVLNQWCVLDYRTPRNNDQWLNLKPYIKLSHAESDFLNTMWNMVAIFCGARCVVQWNLSVTTTSIIKSITCYLFSNMFKWRLKIPIYTC